MVAFFDCLAVSLRNFVIADFVKSSAFSNLF
jgi:hypothetical protein